MVYVSKYKLIGQGTYGCVYKPALKCKENINTTKKLAKVTFEDSAKDELREYAPIARADPQNKYYLGVPEVCTLDTTKENIKALRYSKCKIQEDLFADLKDGRKLKILLLNDGGLDLGKYTSQKRTRSEMNHFWAAAHKMFIAVGVLWKNKMLHADLKASNMVYNPEKKDMNLIDFGLSKSLKEFRKSFTHRLTEHWSYPPEMALYMLKELDLEYINIEHILALDALYYIDCGFTKEEDRNARYSYLNAISSLSSREEFNQMKLKTEETFDIYGLGLGMMASLNNTKNLYSETTYNLLKNCFYGMINPDYRLRYSIDEAVIQYENVLFSTGILDDLGYFISNNTIHERTKEESAIVKIISTDVDKLSDEQIEEIKKTPFYNDPHTCKKGEQFDYKTRTCRRPREE